MPGWIKLLASTLLLICCQTNFNYDSLHKSLPAKSRDSPRLLAFNCFWINSPESSAESRERERERKSLFLIRFGLQVDRLTRLYLSNIWNFDGNLKARTVFDLEARLGQAPDMDFNSHSVLWEARREPEQDGVICAIVHNFFELGMRREEFAKP